MDGHSDTPESMAHTVSVVVPHYNHGKVLGRAISRLINQTFPPHEILIVDDASNDGSLVEAERLSAAHRSVKLVRRQENGGPNAAINTGLELARGTFVCFTAADDFVEPKFLENNIETLVRYPKAAYCFSDPSTCEPATDPEQNQTFSTISLALADRPSYFAPEDMVRKLRRNSFYISSNTVVYRRAAIAEIGGFRDDLHWQADWFANLVLAFRYGACYRPEVLARFTENPAGYGGAGMANRAGQRKLLLKVLDILRNEYRDVAPAFRRAGLVSELSLRALVWLALDRNGRTFLTPHLAARLIARGSWSALRPLTPIALRQAMRRAAGRVGR